MSGTINWQHPFVDVFKQFNVFEQASQQSKGQVSVVQVIDNEIGRKIIKLTGAISANNSVTIPESGNKSLGLNGRYIYVEFYVTNGKYFTLHFDFIVKEREVSIRFTISNLYENYKVLQNSLQIPYPRDSKEKWTILILDIQYFLSNFGLLPLSKYKSFEGIHTLKSFQICSSMSIKGIYTSDNLYDWDTMPKQMLFKLPKGAQWSTVYQIAFWNTKSTQPQIEKQPLQDVTSQIIENLQKIHPPSDKLPLPAKIAQIPKAAQQDELVKKRPGDQTMYTKSIDAPDHPLQPYPIMELDRVIGFTVRSCPDIKWGRSTESQNQVLYTAGNLVIINDLNSGKQRFLNGHSQSVSCLDVSRDGSWIVSGQSGRNSVLRVWDQKNGECLSAFATPYQELICVALSSDSKLLVTSGLDDRNRETIIVWGLQNIITSRKPTLVAKQTSTSNVLAIRFSPIDNNRLISCGHENVRFWRIKNGHLPGSSVVLEHRARSTTFAVLDFEYSYKEHLGGLKHVFFGSKSGLLLQVGYNSMELEAVYKVHDQPVSALCVSAGFCVTGSKDQFLRVWPLDFSEFYIEARHEGIITSLDVSLDGLQVVCGTSTGGLGVLDISTHSYRTIVRSHTAKILQLELHKHSGLLVSLSEDCTIRLWELQKNEQVYEFTFPTEDKCTVLSTHPQYMNFAAGFKSGVIRVFDIENTSIKEEARYHDSEIQHLTYNPSGTFLSVCDAKSIYRIYDTQRGYCPIKTLEPGLQSQNNCSAFSQDSEILATIGDTGTQLNLWDGASWALLLKITATGTHFKQLEFAQNNIELVCGCSEGKIRIYGVERSQGGIHAYFLREQTFMHRGTLNNFYISSNYRFLFSVGGDAFLKVWDYEFSLKGPGSSQVLLGHTTVISSVCQVGSNIVSAGGEEGIFIWNFKGNSQSYQRELDFGNYQMVQSSTFGKGQQGFKQTNQFKQTAELAHEIQQEEQNQEYLDEIDDIQYKEQQNQQDEQYEYQDDEEIPQQQPPQQFQSLARENILQQTGLIQVSKQQQSLKQIFKPYRLEQQFEKQTIEYIRQNIKRKSSLKKFYEFNVPSDILYKQFDTRNDIFPTNAPSVVAILSSQDCHDNLVWCQAEGWVAWTVKNYIVYENILQKDRFQQTLEIAFNVGVLALDPTQQFLLAGCAAKLNSDETAPILVIETKTKEIKNRLNFHTRGVQQIKFSEDGKYMISLGNSKECTVVVWEWPSGKFLSSTYSLDKLNEIQFSKYSFSPDRLFEFCTVGRDQINFWALSCDNVLEYYDVFLPKNTTELDEITAFDYAYFSRNAQQLSFHQNVSQGIKQFKEGIIQNSQTKMVQQPKFKLDDVLQCVVIGLKSGEVIILTYGDFKFVHRNKVCAGEIIGIIINQAAEQMVILSTDNILISIDLLGVTSLNGLIELLNYNSHSIQKIKLPGSPYSFSFEPLTQQGVISFRSGQVSFISIRDVLITDIAATMKEVNQALLINQEIFVTVEKKKIIRIWDLKFGQLLTEVIIEKIITSCFWDSHTRNIVIFTQGEEVRLINIDRLDICEVYNYRGKIYEDTLIIQGQGGSINSLTFNIVLGNNDSFYICQQVYKNLEYSVRLKKILEFSNIDSIVLVADKRLLFLVEKDNGIVNTLLIDYNNERDHVWGFTMLDIFNFKENPHGELDQNIEQIQQTKSLYKDVAMKTQVEFGYGFEGIYFATLSGLQYVYARNYLKQQIIFQIGLSDFPQSFTFSKIGDHLKLLVGMKNSYEEIDPQDQQIKNRKFTHVQNDMKIILSSQNRILCISEEGGVLYQV